MFSFIYAVRKKMSCYRVSKRHYLRIEGNQLFFEINKEVLQWQNYKKAKCLEP